MIQNAISFGENKHINQTRKYNNDPYFIHCLRVARNLIKELDTDKDLIIAALLHDTVEDTKTTLEEVESQFGRTVKNLVEGMTKVPSNYKKLWGKERYYNEGFFDRLKKASETDNRVWKIKLSDRSDNMLDYHKFQSVDKIKTYIWEAEQFLKFVEEYNVSTPLEQKLKSQLVDYISIIDK